MVYELNEAERLWDNVISNRTYNLEEPDKLVMDRMEMLKQKKVRNVVDIGCGLGRHVNLLSQYGYSVLGIDISNSALQSTRDSVTFSSRTHLAMGNISSLPIKSDQFCLALVWRMLHLNTKSQIELGLKEINRILRTNGILLCSVRSISNSLFFDAKESGEEVEPNTFVMKSKSINGLLYHFFSLQEVEKTFSKWFNVVSIEEHELEHTGYTVNIDSHKNMFWVILAQKK